MFILKLILGKNENTPVVIESFEIDVFDDELLSS
jgi:hypothetical protein